MNSLFNRFFSYIDSLRPLDRLIFLAILFVFVITTVWSFYSYGRSFLVQVPVSGGTLIEGSIGSPRFINPVLAITRADHDLVALTYSGLMRLSPEGILEDDLAESVTISEDGRVYNIILKDDVFFHDGQPVTADDIAFTIELIQKPGLKSPIRGNWSGVTVEVVSKTELNLILENPYTPFRENLTLGILPKHIWSSLSEEELPFSQHNIEPIGSGPYRVTAVKRNPAGLISEYELSLATKYPNTAHMERIIIRFYENEEAIVSALNKGEITSTASLSERFLNSLDKDKYTFISEPLPRVFSVFFNQNKTPVLRDQAVRQALSVVIDRDELINRAIGGYGKSTISPIPAGWVDTATSTSESVDRLEAARNILINGGWTQNQNGRWEKTIDGASTPLVFTVRSSNDALFEKTASYLTEVWQTLGVEATFEFYEQSDLVQTIIRPRDYQALLFGMDLGRSLDLYPFWHSSSREDPGLNVSLYANITVDKLVSEIRVATSTENRDILIQRFVSEIASENPAIFLFTPSFEYVTLSDVKTAKQKLIQRPSERFSNITKWYMDESGVWPIFAN